MKKKIVGILAAAVIGTTAFATVASAASGTINVISREDGSGTRGAFIELFGIQEEKDGEKIDMTTVDASITNSTSVMMTTVAGDENAIGYISLGSLNDTVKAVKIDGAEATAENVANDTYKVSRPFNIVTGEKVSEAAQDFVNYIMSEEGQQIVEDNGYIKADAEAKPYEAADVEGICDIGMASRELKDEETEMNLTATVIAKDGIAVVVNNENEVEDLTSDQVKAIFTGETTEWEDLAE